MSGTPAEQIAYELADLLAIPFVLVSESVLDDSGTWVRQVRLPELEGCEATADDPGEALDRLERLRVAILTERWSQGRSFPLPRKPIRGLRALTEDSTT